MTNRHDLLNDVEYLYALAEALMHVPVRYGTDGADIDRLAEIAKRLRTLEEGTARTALKHE